MGLASEVERVTKAKGTWPFSESGIPIMQASAMVGWVVTACSRAPVENLEEERKLC